jgi:galactofuranose transport system ATP-binding protein
MMTSSTQPALLEMSGVFKSFPGVRALSDASLRVGRSEVHALIGQNGAGKSTMIKILTGAYRRDAGSVIFDGQAVDFSSPQAAQVAGIATIYQEVNLVPLRSVAENILLGREPKRWGLIDWKRLNARASAALERFGVHVDVTQPLGTVSIAVQQMTAIARAVNLNAKLVVMDEPTSSLDEGEVETLFGVIRQLKAEGVSVIFVSHKLSELYAVCDRVTIMRDGQTVFESEMAGATKLELVARMLGKDVGEVQRVGLTAFGDRAAIDRTGPPLLQAEHLRRGTRLRDVGLSVHPGETLGLAGLLGAGRTETARAVFGADALEGGQIKLEGRDVHWRSPKEAIEAGFGFCSEDRKIEGIVPDLSVSENLTLALLPRLARNGIVDRAKQLEIVERYIQRLGIKTSGPDQPVRELSGGNQQKVLLARWLCMNPKFLILDEPTRGIDIGAKGEIQALIGDLAKDGLGVLMISSELEELSEGCDRVIVLRDGQSVTTLEGENQSQDAMMAAMADAPSSSSPGPSSSSSSSPDSSSSGSGSVIGGGGPHV